MFARHGPGCFSHNAGPHLVRVCVRGRWESQTWTVAGCRLFGLINSKHSGQAGRPIAARSLSSATAGLVSVLPGWDLRSESWMGVIPTATPRSMREKAPDSMCAAEWPCPWSPGPRHCAHCVQVGRRAEGLPRRAREREGALRGAFVVEVNPADAEMVELEVAQFATVAPIRAGDRAIAVEVYGEFGGLIGVAGVGRSSRPFDFISLNRRRRLRVEHRKSGDSGADGDNGGGNGSNCHRFFLHPLCAAS